MNILFRKIHNVLLDLCYGRILYGAVPSRFPHLGAFPTDNSDYSALEVLFKDRIGSEDVLVDVGCGKGRVINWWLSQGSRNKIIGIELDEEVAQQTRSRLRRYRNVEIVAGNAIEVLPANGTIFYLYNPFNAEVMLAFKKRLEEIVSQRRRDATVIYFNCKYLDVFLVDPLCTITRGEDLHPFAVIQMSCRPPEDRGNTNRS